MNKIINNFLVEDGFLKPESEMDYNYEDQVSYIYHICNSLNEKITVKVVHNGLGEKEFLAQQNGYSCFPMFVPKPINYRYHDGKEFLFLECVLHQDFHAKHLFSQRHVWSEDLPAFFSSTVDDLINHDRNKENDYQFTLELIKSSLPESIYASTKQMLLSIDLIKFKSLPARVQHGDFSVNNLGVRDGRLVIFDWENYDISCTYGLDFTVFVASALNHNANDIIKYFNGNGAWYMEHLRKAFMSGSSLAEKDLIPLFLMCYTIFFTMKKKHGYADEIINKVGSVLKTLFHHYGYS